METVTERVNEIQPYDPAIDTQTNERKWKGDEALYVRFLYVPIFSRAKGHHVQVLHIEVHIPGKAKDVVCRPVREEDKLRFARQWAAFQRNSEKPQDGTPVDECPIIDIARAADLKALKIFTCEQLVAQSDASLQRLMGARALVAKVKTWLEQRKGANAIDKLVEANQALAADNEQKNRAFSDAMKRIEQLEKQMKAK